MSESGSGVLLVNRGRWASCVVILRDAHWKIAECDAGLWFVALEWRIGGVALEFIYEKAVASVNDSRGGERAYILRDVSACRPGIED